MAENKLNKLLLQHTNNQELAQMIQTDPTANDPYTFNDLDSSQSGNKETLREALAKAYDELAAFHPGYSFKNKHGSCLFKTPTEKINLGDAGKNIPDGKLKNEGVSSLSTAFPFIGNFEELTNLITQLNTTNPTPYNTTVFGSILGNRTENVTINPLVPIKNFEINQGQVTVTLKGQSPQQAMLPIPAPGRELQEIQLVSLDADNSKQALLIRYKHPEDPERIMLALPTLANGQILWTEFVFSKINDTWNTVSDKQTLGLPIPFEDTNLDLLFKNILNPQ